MGRNARIRNHTLRLEVGGGRKGRWGSSAGSKLRLRGAKQTAQIRQLVPDSFATQCRNGQGSIINQRDIWEGPSLHLPLLWPLTNLGLAMSLLVLVQSWWDHAILTRVSRAKQGQLDTVSHIPISISQDRGPTYAADHVRPAHWPAHTLAALQPHSETLLSNITQRSLWCFGFEGPTSFLPTPHTSYRTA